MLSCVGGSIESRNDRTPIKTQASFQYPSFDLHSDGRRAVIFDKLVHGTFAPVREREREREREGERERKSERERRREEERGREGEDRERGKERESGEERRGAGERRREKDGERETERG